MLFCIKFIDASVSVNLLRLQDYAWEGRRVWSVWMTLSLECNRTTIEDWLAKFVVVRAVEEVTAVELQSDLVGVYLHTAATLWRVYVGNLDNLAIILAVDNPVVVVACASLELWMFCIDTLANSVRGIEIEWSILHAHNLACRDKYLIYRSYRLAVDCENVVEDCAFAIAFEVEE